MGNNEKAKEYANMGGSMWSSAEQLLGAVLQGDELKKHNLHLLLEHLEMIGSALNMLCQNQDYDRLIWLNEFYLKLMELYFDDGFYGFYSLHAQQQHTKLARIYLGAHNDEQKAYEHLKSAAKFAKQHDDLSGEYIYTSTLLNGYKGNTADISKNYTKTQSEVLLNEIRDSRFDPVRDKDWFKEVESEIRANIAK